MRFRKPFASGPCVHLLVFTALTSVRPEKKKKKKKQNSQLDGLRNMANIRTVPHLCLADCGDGSKMRE